jgi:hypothetical protein
LKRSFPFLPPSLAVRSSMLILAHVTRPLRFQRSPSRSRAPRRPWVPAAVLFAQRHRRGQSASSAAGAGEAHEQHRDRNAEGGKQTPPRPPSFVFKCLLLSSAVSRCVVRG